jgi:hypothetical protein
MARNMTSAEPPPPLRGMWLIAARVGWVVVALAALIAFVTQIPTFYEPQNAPSPSILAGLHAVGWSTSTFITFGLVQDCLVAAVFTAIGWLIFLRKSDDRMALLVAFFLVVDGAGIATSTVAQPPLPSPSSPIIAHIANSIGGLVVYMPLVLFLYLFPTGRFVPRWTRWFALAWVVFSAGYNVVAAGFPEPLGAVIVFSLWGSFLVAQVYRYLVVSTAGQRLQTKWVVYGVAVLITGNLANVLLSPAVQTGYGPDVLVNPMKDELGFALPTLLQGMGGVLALSVVVNLSFVMIPVTLAIAILRYRLFDIDVIINRTLVYGSLTAILGGIYFGSVVILQALLRGITGTTPSVVLVVSTLLIAVLFQPLRDRLQNAIDRGFYREKYNAAKVVDQFSASLQQNVDLDEVTAILLNTVELTIHPSQMSVWIRPPRAHSGALTNVGRPTIVAPGREGADVGTPTGSHTSLA